MNITVVVNVIALKSQIYILTTLATLVRHATRLLITKINYANIVIQLKILHYLRDHNKLNVSDVQLIDLPSEFNVIIVIKHMIKVHLPSIRKFIINKLLYIIIINKCLE